MRLLITGICGFVGSTLARGLLAADPTLQIVGLDNLVRPGAETNRAALRHLGIKVQHADLRLQSDVDALPPCDWVLDAAALPSVLAGVDGRTSPRQLLEHNLGGTLNLLEYCRAHHAGLVLLSTSRVYSIAPLAALPVEVHRGAFRPRLEGSALPPGVSQAGITEQFPTLAPVSLYGATKLASEQLALEYGETYGLPVFINRCGVLAGAGQFGRADQGIFSYWIHRHRARQPLKYIGFGGNGHQVRDCLHPRDLVPLVRKQLAAPALPVADRIANFAGGAPAAMSLRQLTAWCDQRFGAHAVAADPEPRPYDLPWVVLDSAKAAALWDWRPETPLLAILDEIAMHAVSRPDWLDLSSP